MDLDAWLLAPSYKRFYLSFFLRLYGIVVWMNHMYYVFYYVKDEIFLTSGSLTFLSLY